MKVTALTIAALLGVILIVKTWQTGRFSLILQAATGQIAVPGA